MSRVGVPFLLKDPFLCKSLPGLLPRNDRKRKLLSCKGNNWAEKLFGLLSWLRGEELP